MNPILAATDFSPTAANAAAYAYRLAGDTGRRLILFHADPKPLLAAVAYPVGCRSEPEQADEQVRSQLEQLRERLCRADTGARPAVSLESCKGPVIGQLETMIRSTCASLIVVGTRGHTGTERLLFGSTSARAIRKLSRPVLAVPPGVVYQRIRRVGLAFDFQGVHRNLPRADIRNLLTELGAELHIVHVNDASRSINDEQQQQMNQLRVLFKEQLLEFHFITAPSVEGGINEAIREWGMDLIITLPKEHRWADRLFQHSHTRQLLLQANVPVLFLRNQED